ncbi:MAG: C40 family peptidase [Ruminococcus sp.]|nr:C40 family peptidase [Ruminococcus sp.]
MALVMIFSLFGVMPQVEMEASATNSQIESALQWAVNIADDQSHGYSQKNRNGNPDYDCSSFVYYALKSAGFTLHNSKGTTLTYAFTTSTMKEWLTNSGFSYFTMSQIGGESGVQRGDILWKSGHTELYLGDGKQVGAHGCNPTSYAPNRSPNPGDQGDEISVANFKASSWTGIFRYNSGSVPEKPNIYIEKNLYSINETININWNKTQNTDLYWLHIYKDGNDYINQSVNQDLSYSAKYPAGNYTAFIVSFNGIGETLSSVKFVVYDSAPEKPNPYIEKELYSINETVNITWDETKNTEHYWIHIYRDGNDYINQSVNQDLSYSAKYPAGNYTAFIVSFNGIGETLNSVKFYVTDNGDLNHDNEITISDTVIFQKYILGMQTLTQEQAKFADLTQDGIINIFDLTLLKHKLFS